MSTYHIIGNEDTVLGYRFAGVSGVAVSTEKEARAAFTAALADPSITILLITEAVEDMLAAETTAHRLAAVKPYLTVVQDVRGPKGSRRSLQELINEAVGIRIVNQDEEQS